MGNGAGDSPKRTPLYDLHRALGGKMVPFAGYEMPVHYPAGILREHLHTRAAAGLFDVSHMGQLRIRGDAPGKAIEALVPGDIQGLAEGGMRYTQLTNDRGGIRDDLMVTNVGDHLFVVVNAACKDADVAHLTTGLPQCEVERLDDRALIALQGPAAAAVLARHAAAYIGRMKFMSAAPAAIGGIDCFVSRSGYTGEDGYEISAPASGVVALAEALLAEPEVAPIGLGARDSLRLEAGLCLYGHDIDETTTPVEAGLTWSIGKRRREEGGFPGDAVIRDQITNGVRRKRVGIALEGRAPAREHTELTDEQGSRIGEITSGGFGPSVGGPVAMGYVDTAHATIGTPVSAVVRGKPLPARTAKLPFVEQRYYRG